MRSREEQRTYLERLATLLHSPLLPVQSVIAQEIGEDQPFVSRAQSGRLTRITPRVEKLCEYAFSRITAADRAKAAAASIDAEIANGEPARVRKSDHGRASALKDLKAYLDDGYDPRLIVEQLVVLRRAQQMRRPGRSPAEKD